MTNWKKIHQEIKESEDWLNHHPELRERFENMCDELEDDKSKPLCPHCGKPMKNYTPTKGKFKGQKQEYSWVCDCKDFPKHLVIGIG